MNRGKLPLGGVLLAGLSCAAILSASLAPRTSRADVTGLNWNNVVVGGQSYSFVTPVKNQGVYDTCYAYASVAALESQYMITRGDPTFAVDLSEWMLINSGAAGGTGGGQMVPAMNYLVSTGVVTEATYSQSGSNGAVCQDASDLNNILGSAATIKADLQMYGPLVATLTVPGDWYGSYASSGTGTHAVLITGYQDDTSAPGGGYFIVKNSWGTTWSSGSQAPGYGEISYALVGADTGHYLYAFTGPAYFTTALGSGTWNGGSGAWSTSGNTSWAISTTGSPLASPWLNGEYQAVFNNSGGTVTLDPYTSAHGLSICSGATGYTFTGGSLILTGSGIAANESVTINSPLTVGAPQTWTVAAGKQLTIGGPVDLNVSPLTVAGSGNTVINGVIGDVRNDPVLGSIWTGNVGTLTVAGSGTLILGAANTYSGNTLISSGTLQLANSLALQSTTLDTSGSGWLSFGGLTAAAVGGLTSSGNISLTNMANAGVTLTVGGNNANTTYSGSLGGAGGSLLKTGVGTLVLSGANAYDGGTIVNAGDLSFAAATALPAAGTITVGSSGYAGIAFSTTAASFLAHIDKTGTVGVLGFEATPSGVIDLTGFNDSVRLGTRTSATLGSGNTITPPGDTYRLGGGGGTLTVNCVLTDAAGGGSRNVEIGSSGGLPGGTVVLGGANTFTGALTIPSATLSVATINNAGASGPLGAGAGAIVLGDSSGDTGAFSYTGASVTTARQFSLAAGGIGDFDVPTSGAVLTIASAITGGGSLAKTGAGVLALSNTANTYLGSTYFNSGEIGLSSLGSLGSHPTLVFNGGGIQFETVLDPSVLSMTFNGNAVFDTQSLSITLGNPVGNSGSGSLVKTGAGLLTLTASNTYSGGATVSGGTLAILGDWTLGAAGGGITLNGGTLRLAASGINTARTVSLAASSGTIDTDGFDSTFSGNIVNARTGISPGLTKIGDGTLTLSGNNSFNGGVKIVGGTVSVMSTNAFGATFFPAVTVSSGAALQVQNGINPNSLSLTLNGSGVSGDGALRNASGNTTVAGGMTLGSNTRIDSDSGTLTLQSSIAASSSAYTLTFGGAGNVVVPVPLKNVAGLIKDGPGTLTLTGTNTYTGGTSVNNGTLVAANGANGSATGSGNVTLSGGTLASAASGGSISGGVLIGSAASEIAPGGAGSIGTLTIGSLLAASNWTTLDFDLTTPGGSGDLLIITNTNGLALAADTDIAFGTNPTTAGDYRLIGGNFGMITPSDFDLPTAPSGFAYSLSTTADSGYIDLVVTAVPEPSTLILLAVGAIGLLAVGAKPQACATPVSSFILPPSSFLLVPAP